MGHLLHPSATTTAAVRRAIKNSQESIRRLAQRYNLNSKTVAKWKKRPMVNDTAMGPKLRRSNVLSSSEEVLIVAFRQQTLLPLDDCLYALRESMPNLTHSSLHRCLQRHGLSRLPDVLATPKKKSRFKKYPIGYFHIDITEVQTQEGKLHLFVAIDRTTKFVYVEVHEQATRPIAVDFLKHLIAVVPYRIHIILTDNGIQFANQACHKYALPLLFDRMCQAHQIEHRLTKVKHPWTNQRTSGTHAPNSQRGHRPSLPL